MLGSSSGYPYGGFTPGWSDTDLNRNVVGADRGKTVTKPFVLDGLGLSLSEKQIPQVVENLRSGDKSREALEMVALRVKQAL
jgi:hypothetical protein